nr:ribokinase [Neobacillus bataviensis]
MKNFEVIVLNSHGVGQFCNIKRLPALGETLRAWNWRIEEDGGKGTNVSVALGRLNIKTAYIGKVGNDLWGDLGEKWMQDAGVDTTYMYRSDEVATGTGLVMVDEDGRNTIVDGDSSSEALTVEEIRTAIDHMKHSKIFITGFAIPEALAIEGAKMAKSHGITTMLNPSPLPEEPMGDLSFIDYLVLNDVEGKFLLDIPQNTELTAHEIIDRVREKYHCGSVIMTMGSKGSVGLDAEGFWQVEPTSVKAVDTTGAGDGYLAAIAANLIQGNDIRTASEWASKYASLTVTKVGTLRAYSPLKEVDEFILGLQ